MITDRVRIVELQKERDEFPLPWQLERRREYLKGVLCEVVAELLWAVQWHKRHITSGNAVWVIIETENISKLWKKVRGIQGELITQRKILAGREPSITPDMIERAQVYPFDQLYKFPKRIGAHQVALCPFHEEKTPSFTFTPEKNMVYCFGCHWSGDPIGFVMQREGLSFPQAVRRLQ